jgi:tRNA (guanine37-N1)-methyltransferase
MEIHVFSVLPEVMEDYLQSSILGRAQASGVITVRLHNIRDYTVDRHRTTDDEPFGGGGGMVMKPEPIFEAIESVFGDDLDDLPIILLTPQGRLFDQKTAAEFSQFPRLALICGRYEGVDERVREYLVTDEISIGDYVLTGGEIPALAVIDSIARLLPGALGDSEAVSKDSHATGLLEHPHYTRPASFRDWEVPEVLRSGNHALVAEWRRRQSLLRTLLRRPDLLESAPIGEKDHEILRQLKDQLDV